MPPETLAETRDYFEVGNRVHCRVKVRRKDDELRFSIDGARPLEKAALGAPSALCIRVSEMASMDQIAAIATGLLEIASNTRGVLMMEVTLEDGRLVTIELEGRYPMDYAAMAALKTAPVESAWMP